MIFYAQLMYYDMSIDEIYNSMARENFSVWEDQFKDKENIDVYVSEYQKKFCQFHSKQLTKGNSDYIKMYFSFSKKDLCECTTEIFEFVEANKIAHLSKVGERQRADSVITLSSRKWKMLN